MSDKRLRILLALAILVITFIIYNATKAPTLSFWDCGEFIASAYTLGIPHPPGSPLYIMIGRIFSIIPFQTDIAARVNMLSAVSGALAAMMAFLVTLRLIRIWWKKNEFSGWRKIAAYFGALVGTSMFAFGRTHWNNSVEAEVYTLAMLFMITLIYLILRWIEARHNKSSDKYLWLMGFLGFMSIGVHMTVFIIMPLLFLIVIFYSPRFRKDPLFYITGVALVLITISFDVFLWVTLGWLALLIGLFLTRKNYQIMFSILLIVFSLIGFSCQLYTPIRSAQQPYFNQNSPSDSFNAFSSFLERKQYLDQSMITRALTRRASWSHQLGVFQRIGFWGFFYEQYGINYRNFAFIFVLGILGLFELARRKPRIGAAFILMILMGTVFLVWYMNFADGTMQNPMTGEGHIEVRDRDYFFTPGFVLFGMAIGLGVAGIIEIVRESFEKSFRSFKKPALVLVSLLVLMAVVPLKANYYYCDRSNNHIPYDFAYNMLASCEPNAFFFNAGDNDTFPIWCIQAVYGIRPDVTAINLALSNLPWYVKQIRDYMGVPLRWDDKYIDSMRYVRTQDGRLIRIQDQVLAELIAVTGWKRPLNVSQTLPEKTITYLGRPLDSQMTMRGMVYELRKDPQPNKIDIGATEKLVDTYFKFRGLSDNAVYKRPRDKAMANNYSTLLYLVADSLRRAGRFDEAIEETKKAIAIIPYDYQNYNFLAQLYVETGKENLIPDLLNNVDPEFRKGIHYVWARALEEMGQTARSKEMQHEILQEYPDFRDAFISYARLLYNDKEYSQLLNLIETWVRGHPEDSEAQAMLRTIMKKSSETPEPTNPQGN